MRTLNQEYAADAYRRVQRVYDDTEKGEEYQKKYGTMAHKLPVLIHTAGLVQALAFVAAKGKKTPAWRQYLEDVAKTVNGQFDAKKLLEESRQAELNSYILLTRHVSQAALWYKRFAESILKVEASEELGEEDEADEEAVP